MSGNYNFYYYVALIFFVISVARCDAATLNESVLTLPDDYIELKERGGPLSFSYNDSSIYFAELTAGSSRFKITDVCQIQNPYHHINTVSSFSLENLVQWDTFESHRVAYTFVGDYLYFMENVDELSWCKLSLEDRAGCSKLQSLNYSKLTGEMNHSNTYDMMYDAVQKRVIVMTYDKSLFFFNVTIPTQPSFIGGSSIAGYAPNTDILRVKLHKNNMLISYGVAGLQILDITDAKQPTLAAMLTSSDFLTTTKFVIVDFLVTRDNWLVCLNEVNGQITFTDITDPFKPNTDRDSIYILLGAYLLAKSDDDSVLLVVGKGKASKTVVREYLRESPKNYGLNRETLYSVASIIDVDVVRDYTLLTTSNELIISRNGINSNFIDAQKFESALVTKVIYEGVQDVFVYDTPQGKTLGANTLIINVGDKYVIASVNSTYPQITCDAKRPVKNAEGVLRFSSSDCSILPSVFDFKTPGSSEKDFKDDDRRLLEIAEDGRSRRCVYTQKIFLKSHKDFFDSPNDALIVGLAIGLGVALVIIITLALCYRRAKKRYQQLSTDENNTKRQTGRDTLSERQSDVGSALEQRNAFNEAPLQAADQKNIHLNFRTPGEETTPGNFNYDNNNNNHNNNNIYDIEDQTSNPEHHHDIYNLGEGNNN
eukprot:TRINITY_DN983_c0_g4_i1.p1 TRINITY_DN983_c0_g4~~TRINITY_DN983_c0_g4_i1.p1  ORF type:complete len:653 (+),score=110.17 TRINITY_DN983_c0_g4_i1:1656-3614(+)